MKDERKVPSIRFKGFSDDWEQRKLKDIAAMHARIGWQNLRTSEFLDQGDYYLITGTDFDNGEIDFAHCHYVGKDRFDQDKNIQLRIGSILVTKDGTLGKVAYVKELDKPATLNAGVFNVLVNDELDIDSVYLFQYLKAPFLMDFIEKGATGGTIKHLNQGLLVNFPINISSYGEQQRIGRFFCDLDTLITLHQRKLDKLKNVKKALLEKMFPAGESSVPKLRFKGFTDDWEQRKLGEIGDVITGTTPDTNNSEYYSDDGIPWVTPTDIISDVTFSSAKKLSELGREVARVVPKNSILVTCIASIGKNTILGTEGSFNQQINCIIPREKEFDPYFLYSESEIWANEMSGWASSGTMQIVNKSEFSALVTCVPNYQEQGIIGQFFYKIDTLITLHQRKLDKLKNIKKALLDKMFI